MNNPFLVPSVWDKIKNLEAACDHALENNQVKMPFIPAREIEIVDVRLHPPKAGLSTPAGIGRLLHDLASIELQAMELGLRGLYDYPDAPEQFKTELKELALAEGRHLTMCLEGLTKLGFNWGDWPVHLMLWQTVDASDSLLDRILIVHRYLEGSGLDAGDKILRRLNGVDATPEYRIVHQISQEEIGHVQFGSDWYRKICKSEKLNPETDFPNRMNSLLRRLPRRREALSHELRLKAGFIPSELHYLENLRNQINPDGSSAHGGKIE